MEPAGFRTITTFKLVITTFKLVITTFEFVITTFKLVITTFEFVIYGSPYGPFCFLVITSSFSRYNELKSFVFSLSRVKNFVFSL